MGFTMPHTSTHSHSQTPMHTHPGIQRYFLTITHCVGPMALVWVLNPPALDKKETSDYVSNEKLPYQTFKSGNVSTDKLPVSLQRHDLPSWLAKSTGCSHNLPGPTKGTSAKLTQYATGNWTERLHKQLWEKFVRGTFKEGWNDSIIVLPELSYGTWLK